MIIGATCATVAAMLAYASGSDTIQLTGNCGFIEVAKDYNRTVIIDATKATVSGLKITGDNVEWRGGTLKAQDGMQGVGMRGYAVYVSGAGVTVMNATITDARIGAVVVNARNVRFHKNKFWRVRADGMNVSLTNGLTVSYNRFEESRPNPTTCTLIDGRVLSKVKQSECNGIWADGDHADGVQMRNGVENAVLQGNVVTGETNGLTQMDTAGDAPLRNVRLTGNVVQVQVFHTITLYDCIGCKVDGNTVKRVPNSAVKAIIREGAAARCGNVVSDQPGMDPPCS